MYVCIAMCGMLTFTSGYIYTCTGLLLYLQTCTLRRAVPLYMYRAVHFYPTYCIPLYRTVFSGRRRKIPDSSYMHLYTHLCSEEHSHSSTLPQCTYMYCIYCCMLVLSYIQQYIHTYVCVYDTDICMFSSLLTHQSRAEHTHTHTAALNPVQ